MWRVLRVVERTVLPRTVTFRTARGRLDLDVGNQCVMLCPRVDGAFVVDEQFRKEAPEAYEVVRRGVLSRDGETPQGEGEAGSTRVYDDALATLAASREALLGLWGRALAGLCGVAGDVVTEIEAAAFSPERQTEAYRRLGFSALELLTAVAPHVSVVEDSQVLAFFTAQRQMAGDAWLFCPGGWPAAFPREAADLNRISEMSKAAETARVWRDSLADVSGPIMSIMMSSGQEAFLCVAVDDAYVALISRPSAELGSALAAWRFAQQGKGGAQPASLLWGSSQHAGVAQSTV